MTENILNLKIFRWIDKDVVEEIILGAPDKKFEKGEKILLEWSSSNWEWYILKSWKVEVTIKWKKMSELSPWEMFWEIALLNEEERTATITAIEDSEVIILTLDNLINLINNDANDINKEIIRRIEENIGI